MAPFLGRLGSGGGTTAGFGFGKRRSGGAVAFSATGGNHVFTSGLYKYHVFTSPGSFVATDSANVDYLVVGGGGSGGNRDGGNGGGGGGAGAVTYVPNGPITATSYPVSIGPGAPATYPAPIAQATSSSAFGTTAAGGNPGPGFSGSSGGSSGNGNSGGNGSAIGSCGGGRAGGGGGGAGAVGNNATPASPWNAGTGGAGLAVPAFPGPTFTGYMPAPWISAVGPTGLFGGGGGGADESSSSKAGGPGGGGPGGTQPADGVPGVTNTGSGGGGYGGAGCVISRAGGDGAPGIVIIRYLA